VFARAKEPASLGKKAAQPSELDPTTPKYPSPLEQIADLAGARIIAYFPNTLDQVDQMLRYEFQIVERSDKGAELIEEDRLGYQSIHYLVRLTKARSRLPEYAAFTDAIAEIQVRTILQHAWAEIEHDIRYKSASVIPFQIRRRFMALAGMLEIADNEFQAIQDADQQLTEEARSRVEEGHLAHVEITPDALKAFLDRKLGPDGRMSEFTYHWTARILRKLGFTTLEQVEKCISGYDDDQLSRIASGGRLGKVGRFEYMLLAGMGETYIHRHQWAGYDWFQDAQRRRLQSFSRAAVPIRAFDPLNEELGPTAGNGHQEAP
jgi:ppGpp synthetase/RelA/SpoT-type nucleotidyltranferase